MKRKLCMWVILMLFVVSGFSQTQKGYVYLKNGSVLKGKYALRENDQKIVVQSAGNLWVFSMAEVDSISSKRIDGRVSSLENVNDSKFFYRVELGVLVGNSDNSQSAPFSLTGSVNYQADPHFSIGLGTGVEFLKESFMPVFANAEYKFRKSVSTPYVFLKAGYQVPLEKSNSVYYDIVPLWMDYWPWPNTPGNEPLDSKGGLLINPGIGYQWMFSSGFGMNFAVGYQYHRLNYAGDGDYELDIDYNRLTIKLGILFN